MTYYGHVKNGKVVLDEPIDLPDGTRVVVVLEVDAHSAKIDPGVKRFSGILPKELAYRQEYFDAQGKKHG